MRITSLASVAILAVSSVAMAQGITPQKERGAQAMITVQMKGGQKALTDNVKGVILEHDPPKAMTLIITGAKGRGQFTCELKSKDRNLLFDIQRTILFAKDVNVSCANGEPSHRGGVIIDLDDPNGGALSLSAQR
jgi:hypothetical protein